MGLIRWVTAEPTRIVVGAFLAVGILLAAALDLVFWNDVDKRIDERRAALELARVRLETLLRVTENELAVIHGQAQSFVNENPDVGRTVIEPRVKAWLNAPEGEMLSFEYVDAALRGGNVGNLIAFDDNLVEREGIRRSRDSLPYQAQLALSLTHSFQAVYLQNKRLGWVHFNGTAGLVYVYPFIDVKSAGVDGEYFLNDFFQLGRPENNPDRKPFWTPAFADPRGLGPLVTHAQPIYRDDRFIGTVAVDLTIEDLSNFVTSGAHKGIVYLSDRVRRIIGSTDPLATDVSELYPLFERLPGDIAGEIIGKMALETAGQIKGATHLVTFRRLDAIPMTLIEVVALSDIHIEAQLLYGPPAALLTVVLVGLFVLTHRVVGRTFRRVQEANDELRVTHFTLEHAAEGIVWIDPSGLVVEANRMAAEIGGYPVGVLDGQHISSFMSDLSPKKFPEIWAAVKADRRTTPLERTFRRIDGSLVPIETVGKYIKTGDREFICSFFRDITRRKERDDEIRRAKEAAEEATQAKSSFLAMMSHEIRTPMNGVMSMAEMLDQTDLSSDQRSMSQVIRGSAQALLTIINDILDFSKIEAGKLDIEAVEFSLLDVVEGAGELVAGRADEKGLSLNVDLDPSIPDRRIGDPTRLRQILLNLAGNAVKFTEAGSVSIVVGKTGDRLRFEIVDTGIGLTEEQQGRLFQPFQQADSTTSRKFGGTGLGLSICRRLVDMMGGSIGVDSTPGTGSTFWLELPLAAADPAVDRPDPDIADARVLALGFDEAQRRVIERLLAAAGIADARFATADGDAVQDGATPDLVLLAAASGRDTVLEIGGALSAAGHKVVLAAPRALASTLSESDRLGFFANMTLPLRRHRLWRTIAAAQGRADLESRSAQAAGDDIGWTPPEVEEARAAGTLILVAEDNGTNRIVIGRLLAQRGYAHEMAEDGAAALAKIEAGGNYGLLLTDFHMPEMDGFELTGAVRAREAAAGATAKRIPIVALTADALAGTEQRCLDAGMDGYLTKPVDSKLLTQMLERYLPGARALRRRAAAEAPAAPALPAIDAQVLEIDRVAETFGGLNADARDFLEGFAADARRMADLVAAALAADDAPTARHHAHALKGAARSSGAKRLGQIAADIQDCLDGDDLETAKLFAGGLGVTADEFAGAVATLLKAA